MNDDVLKQAGGGNYFVNLCGIACRGYYTKGHKEGSKDTKFFKKENLSYTPLKGVIP